MKQIVIKVIGTPGQGVKLADVDLGAEGRETRGMAGPTTVVPAKDGQAFLFCLPGTLHNICRGLQKGYQVFDADSGEEIPKSFLAAFTSKFAGAVPVVAENRETGTLGRNTLGTAISEAPAGGESGDPQAGSDRHPGDVPQAVQDAQNAAAPAGAAETPAAAQPAAPVAVGSLQGFLELDLKAQMKALDGDVPKALLEELVGYNGPGARAEVQEKAFAKLGGA